MTADCYILAQDLGMIRGERVLFRGISLSVSAGEAIVLRGANGAGKTTLLRILAGLTQAESGTVERHAPHHWVSHREGLKPHETPTSHLALWARVWGQNRQAIPSILEQMGMKRPADVPVRLLSAGQRRRTALARLELEHRPVWLLDEPYTALDKDGRALVDAMITAHCEAGGAVIAAIHGDTGFRSTREILL